MSVSRPHFPRPSRRSQRTQRTRSAICATYGRLSTPGSEDPVRTGTRPEKQNASVSRPSISTKATCSNGCADLVMVGGRNDLVIEPNIMRQAAPNPARRQAGNVFLQPQSLPLCCGQACDYWLRARPLVESLCRLGVKTRLWLIKERTPACLTSFTEKPKHNRLRTI